MLAIASNTKIKEKGNRKGIEHDELKKLADGQLAIEHWNLKIRIVVEIWRS